MRAVASRSMFVWILSRPVEKWIHSLAKWWNMEITVITAKCVQVRTSTYKRSDRWLFQFCRIWKNYILVDNKIDIWSTRKIWKFPNELVFFLRIFSFIPSPLGDYLRFKNFPHSFQQVSDFSTIFGRIFSCCYGNHVSESVPWSQKIIWAQRNLIAGVTRH